jgi:hypothetical protein
VGNTKTQVEQSTAKSTPDSIVEQVQPAPEQRSGPVHSRKMVGAAPPPNDSPMAASVGNAQNANTQQREAPRRAQMSVANQRQLGNAYVVRMQGDSNVAGLAQDGGSDRKPENPSTQANLGVPQKAQLGETTLNVPTNQTSSNGTSSSPASSQKTSVSAAEQGKSSATNTAANQPVKSSEKSVSATVSSLQEPQVGKSAKAEKSKGKAPQKQNSDVRSPSSKQAKRKATGSKSAKKDARILAKTAGGSGKGAARKGNRVAARPPIGAARMAAPPAPKRMLDVSTAPQPKALPREERAARVAENLLLAVTREKQALAQTVSAKQEVVAQQTQRQIADIQSEGENKKQAMEALLARREKQTQKSTMVAKSGVLAVMQSQLSAAQAEGQRALKHLDGQIQSQRDATNERANTQAEQLDTYGKDQSKRILDAGDETGRTIDASVTSAINSVGDVDADVRRAVTSEVQAAATDIRSESSSHCTELSGDALESTSTGSSAIREAGADIATGISGEGSAELVTGILDGTQATTDGIREAGSGQLSRIDELDSESMSALAQMRAELGPSVDAVTETAVYQAEELGQHMGDHIESQAQGTLDALDSVAVQSVEQLTQIDRPLQEEAATEYISGATSELTRGRVESETRIGAVTEQLGGALSALFGQITSGFNKQTERVSSSLSEFGGEVDGASSSALDSYSEASTDSVVLACEANDQAIAEYTSGLEGQTSQAEGGWRETRLDIEHGIKVDIDKGVSQQAEVRSEIPGRLATMAQEAADNAQSSLLSQIWSGIVEGLGNFFLGLLIFAAAVLIVFAVIMIGAALLGIAVVAAKVFLIALAIVAVAFLAYAFVMAMINRSKQFWEFWGTDIPWWGQVLGFFQVFTVAILDVVGIGGIIEGFGGHDLITWEELSPQERARRATEGILTVAFILLVRGMVKKIGTSPKTPPSTRPIIDPNTGRPVGEVPPPRPIIDPNTGRPVGEVPPPRPIIDPNTGRPVGEVPPPRPIIDPNTGRPVGEVPPPRPIIDPNTGRPVGEVPSRPGRPGEVPERPGEVPERPPRGYDPSTKTRAELEVDSDPTPRHGETPAQAAERARLAGEELFLRITRVYELLGDEPREVNIRAEDPTHPRAHTIERHGTEIPLNRADNPGGITIEGRIYGDAPWNNNANASARWLSDSIMQKTVNDYIRANWEAIRSDLALNGDHSQSFNTGNAVGEGFYNSGSHGQGPRNAVYTKTSLVRITIILEPGPPPSFYVLTTFPNIAGTPPGG